MFLFPIGFMGSAAAASAPAAPVITLFSATENGSSLDVELTLDKAAEVFWALSPLEDDPSGAEIEGGTGDVVNEGSLTYEGGASESFSPDFASGLSGNYQFSVVAKVLAAGENPASAYSNIVREASVEVDTLVGDWTISGSSITASPTVTAPTVSGAQITG